MGNKNFGDRNLKNRPMFQATCAECGNICEVPFRPSGDRPIFCSNCFKNKGGFNYQKNEGKKQVFEAVCDKCGNRCEVPFRPTNGKPVFCRNCFKKGDNHGNKNPEQNKIQFEMLNTKLDKILKLLTPNISAEFTPEKKKEKETKVIELKKVVKNKIIKKKK